MALIYTDGKFIYSEAQYKQLQDPVKTKGHEDQDLISTNNHQSFVDRIYGREAKPQPLPKYCLFAIDNLPLDGKGGFYYDVARNLINPTHNRYTNPHNDQSRKEELVYIPTIEQMQFTRQIYHKLDDEMIAFGADDRLDGANSDILTGEGAPIFNTGYIEVNEAAENAQRFDNSAEAKELLNIVGGAQDEQQ